MKKVVAFCFLAFAFALSAQAKELWEKLNNPYPGAIYSILSVNDTTIYAAGNGIYKSTDLGESWMHLDSFGDKKINKLEMDSNGNFYAVMNFSIFRSDDRMKSWKKIQNIENKSVQNLFVFSNGNLLLSCTDSMYISTDNGISWENIGYCYDTDFTKNISKVKNMDVIYTFTGDYFYKSDDFGELWMLIDDTFYHTYQNSKLLTTNDTSSYYFFNQYLFYNHKDSTGKFVSKLIEFDFDTFDYNYLSPTATEIINDNFFIAMGNSDWNPEPQGIWMIKKNDSVAVKKLSIPSANWSVNDIKYISNGNLIAATDYGIYKSNDYGETWTEKNIGVHSFIQINQIHTFGQKDIYISCTDNIFFRSPDNGITWEMKKFPGSYSIHSFVISKKGDLFIGGGGAGSWRSTDKGDTWTSTASSASFSDACVPSMGVDSNGAIYALSLRGIFISTDNGDTWRKSLSNLKGNIWNVFHIGRNNLLYGIFETPNQYDIQLGVSTDGGNSFQNINVPFTGFNLENRFFSVWGDSTIYILSDSVYRSTNCGTSWSAIGNKFYFEEYNYIFNDSRGNLLLSLNDPEGYDNNEISNSRLLKYDITQNRWSDITFNTNNNNNNIDYITQDSKKRIIISKGLLYRSNDEIENIPNLNLTVKRNMDYDDIRYYDSLFFDLEVRNSNGILQKDAEIELIDESNNSILNLKTNDNGLAQYKCPITNTIDKFMLLGFNIKHNDYKDVLNQRLVIPLGFFNYYSFDNYYINDSLYIFLFGQIFDKYDKYRTSKTVDHVILYNPLADEYIKTKIDSTYNPILTYCINDKIDSGSYIFKFWGAEEGWAFINCVDTINIINNLNGVIEQASILAFENFPNPTTGKLNICYHIFSTGIIGIYLSDALGNSTLLKSEYRVSGDYTEQYNLNEMPQGIYNVVLKTGYGVFSKKVVLLR